MSSPILTITLKKKNNLISSREFNRYIKPQIRNIVSEYYFILKKMDPFQGQSINFQNHFNQIYSNWEMESKKVLCRQRLFYVRKPLKPFTPNLLNLTKKHSCFLLQK